MTSTSTLGPPARPDTPTATGAQGAQVATRLLRTRTLILLRCGAMFGQLAVLLAIWLTVHWPLAYIACFALVGASALVNLVLALSPAARREARPWEASGQLSFDIVQFSGLLLLTGGIVNPFCLLLIAPVTLAGATLARRDAIAVGLVALAAVAVLADAAAPPPWRLGGGPGFFPEYRLACAAALVAGLAFAGGYAAWAARAGARMELALRVTEMVLGREQRLSALGALAAAAAHELGTPLATITVVARELVRATPKGPLRDDATLLIEQAQRCRDILHRLAETPERTDVVHERMSLLQLVREAVSPYAAAGPVRAEAVVTGPPGMAAPDVWRRPEVLHAVTAIVENAFDFARAEILVTARFDADIIGVEVKDDGPGFAPEVFARLGEPYVTSRPGAESSRTDHVGMGLGFFIAKTLLERTGAKVDFANAPAQGAVVRARWPRALMEATEASFERLEMATKTAT